MPNLKAYNKRYNSYSIYQRIEQLYQDFDADDIMLTSAFTTYSAILLDSLLTAANHPHKLVLFNEGGHDLYSVFDSVIYERELWFNTYIDN